MLSEATRQPIDNPILRCLREGRMVELVEPSLLVNRRGQEISIQDSAAPIRDRSGRLIGAVMVFHDVSQERRLQRALAYQATHDALTGLINRREFESRLNDALQRRAGTRRINHVLLYLDLDQFKVVNDTCGHQAGDRLLKQLTSVRADAHPHDRHARAPRRRRVRRAARGLHARDRAAASPRTCARRSATSASSGRTA